MSAVIVFDYTAKRVTVVGNDPQQEPALSKVLDAQKVAVPAAAGSSPHATPEQR
jgi:hypothetical protein